MRLSRLLSMLIWGAGGLFAALGFIVFVNAGGKLEQSPFNVSDGNKFDGIYDFRFTYPGPSGTESINSPGYIIISNGDISSSDGTVSGTVDDSGYTIFSGPCPTNPSIADFRGSMDESALEGFNFGQGKYECRVPLGGGIDSKSWSIRES